MKRNIETFWNLKTRKRRLILCTTLALLGGLCDIVKRWITIGLYDYNTYWHVNIVYILWIIYIYNCVYIYMSYLYKYIYYGLSIDMWIISDDRLYMWYMFYPDWHDFMVYILYILYIYIYIHMQHLYMSNYYLD